MSNDLTRRTVLGGAGAAVAALSLSGPAGAMPRATTAQLAGVPSGARRAGFTTLALDSHFWSLDDIDLAQTSDPSKTWFHTAPWGEPTAVPADYRIITRSNGHSFLRLNPSATNCNWNLSTLDPLTGAGRTFSQGYFEARLRFQPQGPITDWSNVSWPAFWLCDAEGTVGRGGGRAGEIDIMEAMGENGQVFGCLHDLNNAGVHYWTPSSSTVVQTGADFARWHTYAAAWGRTADGRGYVRWSLDNVQLAEVTFGPGGVQPHAANSDPWTATIPENVFDVLNDDRLTLVVGSGRGYPLDVDWVRVWQ